ALSAGFESRLAMIGFFVARSVGSETDLRLDNLGIIADGISPRNLCSNSGAITFCRDDCGVSAAVCHRGQDQPRLHSPDLLVEPRRRTASKCEKKSAAE